MGMGLGDLYYVLWKFLSFCHSRAGGNPGFFHSDQRKTWTPAFAGVTTGENYGVAATIVFIIHNTNPIIHL